jgi:hypothetical protein
MEGSGDQVDRGLIRENSRNITTIPKKKSKKNGGRVLSGWLEPGGRSAGGRMKGR